MNKNGMGFILTFLVTGILCACDDATTPEPVIPHIECVIPSEPKTIECTETPEIFEIEPNVKNVSVHFSDAVSSSEKEIYLTVTNPTETAFDGIYSRTVIESSSNVNTNTVEARTASSGEDFFEAENFCGSRKADVLCFRRSTVPLPHNKCTRRSIARRTSLSLQVRASLPSVP